MARKEKDALHAIDSLKIRNELDWDSKINLLMKELMRLLCGLINILKS